MSGLVFMIPIALIMGLAGLAAFLWAVRTGQFDDPDGAAHRILISPDEPLPDETAAKPGSEKPPPEFGG